MEKLRIPQPGLQTQGQAPEQSPPAGLAAEMPTPPGGQKQGDSPAASGPRVRAARLPTFIFLQDLSLQVESQTSSLNVSPWASLSCGL